MEVIPVSQSWSIIKQTHKEPKTSCTDAEEKLQWQERGLCVCLTKSTLYTIVFLIIQSNKPTVQVNLCVWVNLTTHTWYRLISWYKTDNANKPTHQLQTPGLTSCYYSTTLAEWAVRKPRGDIHWICNSIGLASTGLRTIFHLIQYNPEFSTELTMNSWMRFLFSHLAAKLRHTKIWSCCFFSGACSSLRGVNAPWQSRINYSFFAPSLGFCWGQWEPKNCSG